MRGGVREAFSARTGGLCRDGAIGQANGTTIGELQVVFQQAAVESEARNIGRILKAIELFFLDSENNAFFVEQGDRGTGA